MEFPCGVKRIGSNGLAALLASRKCAILKTHPMSINETLVDPRTHGSEPEAYAIARRLRGLNVTIVKEHESALHNITRCVLG